MAQPPTTTCSLRSAVGVSVFTIVAVALMTLRNLAFRDTRQCAVEAPSTATNMAAASLGATEVASSSAPSTSGSSSPVKVHELIAPVRIPREPSGRWAGITLTLTKNWSSSTRTGPR